MARFCDFSYWYPESDRAALSHVDLQIAPGMTVLEGRSGSGKTTLLRCLAGLVPHFHGGRALGEVEVLGQRLRQTNPRQLARLAAIVFQEPEAQLVLPVVAEDVAFGPANLGLPREQVLARVEAAMAAMGVSRLAGRRVATLSGGERQRVAIAGALAMAPALLLLDEPISQVDEGGVLELRQGLAELGRAGVAVVVSDHRPERLAAPGTERVCLVGGTVGDLELTPEWPSRAGRCQPGAVAWEARDLSIGHLTPVVEGIDLRCRRGEVVAVTGPNGAGKTTLLRTLAGLHQPLGGEVLREPGRRAYLPQDPGALLHQPTVLGEVEQTIAWLGLQCSAGAVMTRFGLLDLASRDPRDLSTGQRQRVALAAILVGDPEMVFLDEPTRAADQPSRAALVQAVDLLTRGGAAVMVATTDREFAERIADSVLVVEAGRLRATARLAR